MIAVNLNSTVLNPVEEVCIGRRLLRRMGMDLYREGRPLSDCLTADERAGWWAANAAEGECVTLGYAQSRGF